jgi:cytidylate kinase
MTPNFHFDQCLSFLNCQVTAKQRRTAKSKVKFRAVTLSRQTGSGVNAIAERLVQTLNGAGHNAARPWTIFNRNHIAKILSDPKLPERVAKSLPEGRIAELQDTLEEVLASGRPSWGPVQHASETLLRLAALGNVVLVGRAGNLVTHKLPGVLHVRLVGSLETRVRRLAETRGMTRKSALDFLEREDLARQRYVKKYFSADINDPLLYHLVINTDMVSTEAAAATLVRIVTHGF